MGVCGQDIEVCGQAACVAKTRKGKSLKTIDVSDPQNLVRIYEITDERSPVLLGEVQVGGKVEALVAGGDLLHVVEHAGQGWQGCISGSYCPRGTQVEVYDISDPAAGGLSIQCGAMHQGTVSLQISL